MTAADQGPGQDPASGPGPDAAPGSGPDAAPGADPGEAGDLRLARLLRWYPRAWRKRYGEEFLALVEDTLGGREPGWRLHLGVVWAGLRERGRRAVPATLRRIAKDAERPVSPYGIGLPVLSSLIYFWSMQSLARIWLSAEVYRCGNGAVAADALAALCAVIGVAVVVGGLAALPALVRFLRAGGWPDIRQQAARAVATTAVGAGALTRLLLMARSMTYEQLLTSDTYTIWFVVTLLLLQAALLLWWRAATATAERLDLAPGVRAVQVVLGAAATSALLAIAPVQCIWTAQVQDRGWLLGLGVVLGVFLTRTAPFRLRRAWRRAGELRRS